MISDNFILKWRAGVRRRILPVCVMLISSATLITATADEVTTRAGEPAPPYRIEDGKVDQATFMGWRVYHSSCHGCHGVDGTGTSVAPSLVNAVASMSSRDFSTKVLTRYRLVIGFDDMAGDDSTALRAAFMEQVMRRESGELIMPAWGSDPNVQPHVLDLYAYLRARADGALGTGRPEKLNE